MKNLLLAFAVLGIAFSLSSYVCAQSANTREENLLRRVEGRTLTSTSTPPIRVKFGKDFKYAGSQRFVLYDKAQVEQYYFVDADKQNRIKRMFIVQFEGYWPSNNDTYNYPAAPVVNLAGQDYFANAMVMPNVSAALKRYPDSDTARAALLLINKGYRVGEDVLFQRFARVVDTAKHNEVLLIYIEDMKSTGFTASEISKGGRAESQRDRILQESENRALKSFQIIK